MPFKINPFTGTLSPVVEDLAESNTRDILYIKGDEFTNGSIRLVLTAGESIGHIEERANGVWNDTGFRFHGNSVELGRDLDIGAGCSFIKTFNPTVNDANQSGLVPAIAYKTPTGSISGNAPIVDALVTTGIFTTAVSEIIATTIGFIFISDYSRLIDQIFHEVGSVGAVDECQYSVYVGTDNTGPLMNRINIPAGELIANTTLTVDFGYVLALRNTITHFIEIDCKQPFSLKTDISGKPLTTFSEGRFGTVGMVLENMIFDNNNDHILDNSLNPVYGNFF